MNFVKNVAKSFQMSSLVGVQEKCRLKMFWGPVSTVSENFDDVSEKGCMDVHEELDENNFMTLGNFSKGVYEQ